MDGRDHAQDFINNPPQADEFLDEMILTLRCLLAEGNPYISTEEILEYLSENNHAMNKNVWQQDVLGRLRDNYVFIGGSRNGMFLIENRELALEAYGWLNRRIERERDRLDRLQEVSRDYGFPIP